MHHESSHRPSHPGILSFSIHEDDHIGHTKHPCQNQHRPSNLSVLTPENPLIAFRPSLSGKPTLRFIITRIPSTSPDHPSKPATACTAHGQQQLTTLDGIHRLTNHAKRKSDKTTPQTGGYYCFPCLFPRSSSLFP